MSTAVERDERPDWKDWAIEDKLWLRWRLTAREEQLPPPDPWDIYYLRGGRGSGKTRSASETFGRLILANEPGEWGVVAPTYGDARDICIEGPSGLLRIMAPVVENWNRSIGELYIAGGRLVRITGADEGAPHIQGQNLRGCWCDEVGLWKKKWRTAWEESIRYAVRLEPAKIICTGTPKAGHPLVRELMADPGVIKRGPMSMRDNIRNLAPSLVKRLVARYGGTQLGRQELEGEVIDEVEGALWRRKWIEEARVEKLGIDLSRIVVGVDPAGTSNEDSDETGIIVAGKGECRCKGKPEQHYFVLADRSGRASPDGWGRKAVLAYAEFSADRIIGEQNNGGEMVEHVIRTVAKDLADEVKGEVSYKSVHASRGKAIRAEPVAALGEQRKVHHVGGFPELEDQLVTWTPGDDSPDRLDGYVWAISELMSKEEMELVAPISFTRKSPWK